MGDTWRINNTLAQPFQSDKYVAAVLTTFVIGASETFDIDEDDVGLGMTSQLNRGVLKVTAINPSTPLPSPNNNVVSTVTQLETAVKNQAAGEVIEILGGNYTLTQSLSILVAASGGVLRGIGDVTITGAAAADEAFKVDPAAGSGAFEYTFENVTIRGGADKVGVQVDNATIAQAMTVNFNNCVLNQNTSGNALDVDHSDATKAITVNVNGTNVWDGPVNIVPASTSDRFNFTGVELIQGLAGGAVDIAAVYKFRNCVLLHEGITGGHANNLVFVAGCYSYTDDTTALAATDASDFPDDFNPTIV